LFADNAVLLLAQVIYFGAL